MFMGVTSYCSAGPVASYADACAVLDTMSKTATGRARIAGPRGFPLGLTARGRTAVRKDRNDTILFRLYETDVVAWHPDNSFSIDSYASVTTAAFANQFTPDEINVGVDCTITYATMTQAQLDELRDRDAAWRSYWSTRRICHGDVRFTQDPETALWAPDEDTCTEFRAAVLDHKGARRVSRQYHLREFENWLSMAPMHLDLVHDKVDLGRCADALERKDWRTAAEHLPLIREPDGFGIKLTPLRIETNSTHEFVTPSSLKRLRDWLYGQENLFTVETHRTLPVDRYVALTRRAKALNNSDTRVLDGRYSVCLGWR